MLKFPIERTLLYILLFVLLFVPHVWAVSYPFESARPLYIGSRPLGMGNAFTSLADDAEASFWNPAGLIQWQGVKVFGSIKVWDRGHHVLDSKCVAYSYRDTAFSWGNKIALRVDDNDVPDFTYYSVARKLSPYVALGCSVKFRRRHPCEYYQFFGHSPGYDLGILYRPNALNSGGALIQNMGDAKRWISVVTLGFTHRSAGRWLLSVDISVLFDDGVTLEPHVGWEWQVTSRISARVGTSDGYPTAGIGLRLPMLRLDYAWIRDVGGNAHFLSGQLEF